jgi:pimeloyl-ACP methyl ester carboxylesterase
LVTKSRTFVLMHGAWHTGKAWRGVTKRLTALGHKAHAPTLPGHVPEGPGHPISYDDYIAAIAGEVRALDTIVTLVGHSSAGHLMQAVAPHLADRLEHLIFHNAFVLGDGECQLQHIPPEVGEMMMTTAYARDDRAVPPDDGFVRNVLMAGDSKKDQDRVLAQLVPQPIAFFETPVGTEAFKKLTVSRSVVFATQDSSLPKGAYLSLAAELGDCSIVQIPGGHEALIVDPVTVADAFVRAGSKN